jgi:hypothetical protein
MTKYECGYTANEYMNRTDVMPGTIASDLNATGSTCRTIEQCEKALLSDSTPQAKALMGLYMDGVRSWDQVIHG